MRSSSQPTEGWWIQSCGTAARLSVTQSRKTWSIGKCFLMQSGLVRLLRLTRGRRGLGP